MPPILLRVPPVSPTGVNFSPLVAALLILLPKTVQLGPGEARWTAGKGWEEYGRYLFKRCGWGGTILPWWLTPTSQFEDQ